MGGFMMRKKVLSLFMMLLAATTLAACGKSNDDKEAIIYGTSMLLETAQDDDSTYVYTGSYSEDTNTYSIELSFNENCTIDSDEEIVRETVISILKSENKIHSAMENIYAVCVDYLAQEDIKLEVYHIDENGKKCYYSGKDD